MLLSTLPIALAAALLCLGKRVAGQCNPLQGSCAPIPGLLTPGSSYYVDFTQHSATPSDWIQANYENVSYGNNGAEFSLVQQGDAPYIWTNSYFLFGRVDVVMQAAPGTGVVTSAVLMSDDMDEIDWEFSGNNFALSGGHVQTNYFGKGITGNYDRGTQPSVSDPTKAFHTYSLDWSASKLVWSIDGTIIRTLSYSPATSGAYQYPQSPMRLHLGLWDGGDPNQSQGVVQWAGGYTDLTKLPYTAYVKSVKITPSSQCANYVYGDKSGSYQSVQCKNSTLPITSSSSSSALPLTTMTSLSTSSITTSYSLDPPTSSSIIRTSTNSSTRASTSVISSMSLTSSMSQSTTRSMSVSLASSTSTNSRVSLSYATAVITSSVTAEPVSSPSSTSATSTVSDLSSNPPGVTISSSLIAPNHPTSATPGPISASSNSSVAFTTTSASTSFTAPYSAPVVILTPIEPLSVIPAST